jgi:glycine/D-amino acid oxidase-like deaminating enzyme
VQTTVVYFRPNSTLWQGAHGKCEAASALLFKQPVLVDYGMVPAWTSSVAADSSNGSASMRSEDDLPLIYSCPSLEFPGLIKYAVHNGVATTADERTFVPDTAATIEPVRRWLRKHARFVSDVPVLAETCLYTNTPDEDFIIDMLPGRPHIVVAAGFSGHGFKFTPLVGQAAACLALTGRAPFDVSSFRISRPTLGLKHLGVPDAPARPDPSSPRL